MLDISEMNKICHLVFYFCDRGENKGSALNISIAQLTPLSFFISCRELPSKWLIKAGVLRYPVLLNDNYLRLKAKDQQIFESA